MNPWQEYQEESVVVEETIILRAAACRILPLLPPWIGSPPTCHLSCRLLSNLYPRYSRPQTCEVTSHPRNHNYKRQTSTPHSTSVSLQAF